MFGLFLHIKSFSMKNFILLALVLTFVGASCSKDSLVPDNTQLVHVDNITTYNQEIAAGVSVVFFHATWCTKCASQRPALENMVGKSDFSSVFFGQVDYEKNTNIVNQSDVFSFPTILIYKDGVEKARYEGTGHSQATLEAKVKELL